MDQTASQLVFFGTTAGQTRTLEPLLGSELLRFVVTLIVWPILVGISIFVMSGVLRLLVRLVVDASRSGFETRFRSVSYPEAVALLVWIPIVGPLLSLYAYYLIVVGIREMHRTTTGPAIEILTWHSLSDGHLDIPGCAGVNFARHLT